MERALLYNERETTASNQFLGSNPVEMAERKAKTKTKVSRNKRLFTTQRINEVPAKWNPIYAIRTVGWIIKLPTE